LIDCDDQADFWQFYTGKTPIKSQDLNTQDNITIICNKDRKSIRGLAKPQQYDHVVLDKDKNVAS